MSDNVREAALTGTEANEALRKLFPPAFEKETTYHCGQQFEIFQDGDNMGVYLLCRSDERTILLASIADGNRFSHPEMVSNPGEITIKEMNLIAAGQDFKLIK